MSLRYVDGNGNEVLIAGVAALKNVTLLYEDMSLNLNTSYQVLTLTQDFGTFDEIEIQYNYYDGTNSHFKTSRFTVYDPTITYTEINAGKWVTATVLNFQVLAIEFTGTTATVQHVSSMDIGTSGNATKAGKIHIDRILGIKN